MRRETTYILLGFGGTVVIQYVVGTPAVLGRSHSYGRMMAVPIENEQQMAGAPGA
jgi:hypothetical protein